jgi:hypothetical protein
MNQVQGMSKEVELIQEEKTMEYPRTQEVLPKIKGIIIHQHIQGGFHMHPKNHKISQKCLHSNIKGEGMGKTNCKEILER